MLGILDRSLSATGTTDIPPRQAPFMHEGGFRR